MVDLCAKGDFLACLIIEYGMYIRGMLWVILGSATLYLVMMILDVGLSKMSGLLLEFRDVLKGKWTIKSINAYTWVGGLLISVFVIVATKISFFTSYLLLQQKGSAAADQLLLNSKGWGFYIALLISLYGYGAISLMFSFFTDRRSE